ncbi:MAG TPA: uracil-DNA glycosylase [Anaerolineae bacterium]|jgi:DNA polymerase|nr:uracil-DNA glycosylase [Anaerolineae bacterium]
MQFGLFEEPLRFDNFDELVESMESMEDDPLFSAGTNMVIYRGNPEARLMIIGEAPGTEEDRQGKPFVGRSGQLLDQILGAVELDPEQDVFITNAVFRLPPGTGGKPLRKPTPDEIAFYKPYVLEIIRFVDPVIILLSGNAATEAILGETGITRLRGNWYPWHGRWLMPIFHPAYLLRNPSRNPGSPKALTWQDIREVRRKYDEIVG